MAVDLRNLTPAEWAFVVVLLLLAMAGLYYVYTLLCGYRCLPLETTDCPGGKPHQLVYVNDVELGMLADHAEHAGKPCHGIRSFPPQTRAYTTPPGSPRSSKRQKTAPSIEPGEAIAQTNLFEHFDNIDGKWVSRRSAQPMGMDQQYRFEGVDDQAHTVYEDGAQWLAHQPYVEQEPLIGPKKKPVKEPTYFDWGFDDNMPTYL